MKSSPQRIALHKLALRHSRGETSPAHPPETPYRRGRHELKPNQGEDRADVPLGQRGLPDHGTKAIKQEPLETFCIDMFSAA